MDPDVVDSFHSHSPSGEQFDLGLGDELASLETQINYRALYHALLRERGDYVTRSPHRDAEDSKRAEALRRGVESELHEFEAAARPPKDMIYDDLFKQLTKNISLRERKNFELLSDDSSGGRDPTGVVPGLPPMDTLCDGDAFGGDAGVHGEGGAAGLAFRPERP